MINSNRRNKGRSGLLKKTWLISPKDNWPPITKSGLSMSLDDTMNSASNVQYFVYEHGPSYRQVQLKFLDAVESLDPQNIIVRCILLEDSKKYGFIEI